jgi:hypothetical protein
MENNNCERYFIIYEQDKKACIEEWFDSDLVNKRTIEISMFESTNRAKLIKVIYGKPVDLFCIPAEIKTITMPL